MYCEARKQSKKYPRGMSSSEQVASFSAVASPRGMIDKILPRKPENEAKNVTKMPRLLPRAKGTLPRRVHR